MAYSVADEPNSHSQRLDSGPPRPPRSHQSLMSMASGGDNTGVPDMSSQAVRVLKAMGDSRAALLVLAAELPTIAAGVQQFIQGLESVVPQQLADIVAGNPPGSGGAGMGAAGANAAPTAPPVQNGMP